jgi:salicylate hydroxylase
MGGFSPTPASLPPGAACGWYGNAKYAVTYPVDDKYSVWALTTMGKDEERETWRQTDHMAREKARLTEELAGWPQPVRDLFEKSDSMVKFGLYDRPELSAEHWYHGRCVLVGDAAHPTRCVVPPVPYFSKHYGCVHILVFRVVLLPLT